MHKMMIVDDEPLVRLALHHLVDWQALRIEIVCEAGDGVEGLALLQQRGDIDLLLVDIQMPRMNGIELLKALNDPALPKRPVPIILSAYSDYSYVREAFLLGALDYIVKADMDEEHIAPVMAKAVQELARPGGIAAGDSLAQALSSSSSAEQQSAKEAFFQKLLDFDPMEDPAAYRQWIASQGTFLHETNQTAVVVQVAKGTDMARTHGFIQQTIQTALHEMSLLHEIVRREAGEYVLLCAFPHDRSESAIREKIHSALTMIQTRLLQYVNASVTVGVSDLASGSPQWHRLYRQARVLATRSYYEGLGKLFYRESVPADFGQKDARDSALWDDLLAVRQSLLQALKLADESHWIRVYGQLERRLQDARRELPEHVRVFFVDLLWELGGVLYAKGIRMEAVQGSGLHPFDELKRIETLDETMGFVSQLLHRVHPALHGTDSMPVARYSTPIANAKKFLDQHYREEVNQTLISEMVGVSESYLSKQFVKEVGCNFIHYLTKLRIDEAKWLLEQGIKISDISERIGYLNPEHFSRIFKKMTGYSPKAYRESLEKV
ncbi:helix-turn-helix domain-containing protein [Paenibacillus sp. GCM10027628]|uniref:helix-turn-helix domain-containing protein n=1 Tax=Paenibacillus sp. GCM10027628 TaxID=3273413 RepID=UPI00362A06A3